MQNWNKLLWLSLGAFAIGTESYALAGLLPDVARDLSVTVPIAGQLVTAFALAYAIGSPLLAIATANFGRRRVLITSILVFGAFNLLAATAHTYAVLFVARVGMALAAGTFTPAASAYAVAVSKPEHRGRALSIIYSGLTVATMLGVPLGVFFGGRFGWRFIFLGATGVAIVAAIGLALNLVPVANAKTASLSERLTLARRPEILLALSFTTVALTGAFSIYTFLAPFLQETTGLAGGSIALVLFLFGLGSFVGNLVSGIASDRFGPRRVLWFVIPSLLVLFAALSVISGALPPATARWFIIPVIAAWGLIGFSFASAQQTRIVALAPEVAPITLSLNGSAIYIGVSLGSILGSLVVAHSSVTHVGYSGAAGEALAIVLLAISAPKRAKAKALAPVTPLAQPEPVSEAA